MTHRLGDRDIARVIEDVLAVWLDIALHMDTDRCGRASNARQVTVRVVTRYDIERAVRNLYAVKRWEGGQHFRHWRNL